MKYEFTGETKEAYGITLKRIRRISDGLVGGWIEKESNLSQEGSCFVSGDATVFGAATVSGNARVYGDAKVSGNARVYGNAEVSGDATVFGNATVSGDATVSGNARVYGNATVFGDARVYGNATVFGDATVSGNAEVPACLYVQQPRSNITITDNYIAIGCQRHTWEHWNNYIEEIGIKHSYSKEEIEETRQLIEILKSQINQMKGK